MGTAQPVPVPTCDKREDMRVTTKWMTPSVVGMLALLAWTTLGEAASIGPGAFVSLRVGALVWRIDADGLAFLFSRGIQHRLIRVT